MLSMSQALHYIESSGWQARTPGLQRIALLMERLGNPEKALRFVHIAGSNGKGSTAAMLDAILRAAGFRAGLFTSPHLLRYNERIQVDGAPVSDGAFSALAEEIQEAAAGLPESLSEFEILTAMGFLHFLREKCDLVVLETGMGGRLDSTNVIPPPEAAVITSLSLEHTAFLGDTLEKIAGEKAGIIKPGTPVVLCGQTPEAEGVIRETCAALGCPLTVTGEVRRRSGDLFGQRISYRERENLFLKLPGVYQCRNAAVVLDTVEVLRRRGWRIAEDAVRAGLAGAVWPGRFEVLRREPLFLLDGAHNLDGVLALAECLRACVPEGGLTFLMGVMADKDYGAMLDAVAPFAESFITVRPESPRALASAALAEAVRTRLGLPARDGGSVENGLALALDGNGPVCAFGSLYQAGEIREKFAERRM